jgi:hypothetical protein
MDWSLDKFGKVAGAGTPRRMATATTKDTPATAVATTAAEATGTSMAGAHIAAWMAACTAAIAAENNNP